MTTTATRTSSTSSPCSSFHHHHRDDDHHHPTTTYGPDHTNDDRNNHDHTSTNKTLLVRYDDDIYRDKDWKELCRSYGIYQLLYYNPFRFVQRSETILSYSYRMLGRNVTNTFIRYTFYHQFCAGETIAAITTRGGGGGGQHVGRIYDYAAEADIGIGAHLPSSSSTTILYDDTIETLCDDNVKHFKQCIQEAAAAASSKHDDSSLPHPYIALKMTALCHPILLYEMTRRIINQEATSLQPMMNTTPDVLSFVPDAWFDDHSDLKRMRHNLEQRLHDIMDDAKRYQVRILMDAEQTWYQPAINTIVPRWQHQYNTNVPLLYQTYQMYLKDSMKQLIHDMELSRRYRYTMGMKLVRGAYMESERDYAKQQQRPSPIHDTIEQTHHHYNQAIQYILSHSRTNQNNMDDPSSSRIPMIELVLATHNEESIAYAIELLRHRNHHDHRNLYICFAQLYGMMDYMTYQLIRHRYHVYKYMTYGSIDTVLPYLVRRAQENSAMLLSSPSSSSSHAIGGSNAEKEIHYLKREMIRRFLGMFMGHSNM